MYPEEKPNPFKRVSFQDQDSQPAQKKTSHLHAPPVMIPGQRYGGFASSWTKPLNTSPEKPTTSYLAKAPGLSSAGEEKRLGERAPLPMRAEGRRAAASPDLWQKPAFAESAAKTGEAEKTASQPLWQRQKDSQRNADGFAPPQWRERPRPEPAAPVVGGFAQPARPEEHGEALSAPVCPESEELYLEPLEPGAENRSAEYVTSDSQPAGFMRPSYLPNEWEEARPQPMKPVAAGLRAPLGFSRMDDRESPGENVSGKEPAYTPNEWAQPAGEEDASVPASPLSPSDLMTQWEEAREEEVAFAGERFDAQYLSPDAATDAIPAGEEDAAAESIASEPVSLSPSGPKSQWEEAREEEVAFAGESFDAQYLSPAAATDAIPAGEEDAAAESIASEPVSLSPSGPMTQWEEETAADVSAEDSEQDDAASIPAEAEEEEEELFLAPLDNGEKLQPAVYASFTRPMRGFGAPAFEDEDADEGDKDRSQPHEEELKDAAPRRRSRMRRRQEEAAAEEAENSTEPLISAAPHAYPREEEPAREPSLPYINTYEQDTLPEIQEDSAFYWHGGYGQPTARNDFADISAYSGENAFDAGYSAAAQSEPQPWSPSIYDATPAANADNQDEFSTGGFQMMEISGMGYPPGVEEFGLYPGGASDGATANPAPEYMPGDDYGANIPLAPGDPFDFFGAYSNVPQEETVADLGEEPSEGDFYSEEPRLGDGFGFTPPSADEPEIPAFATFTGQYTAPMQPVQQREQNLYQQYQQMSRQAQAPLETVPGQTTPAPAYDPRPEARQARNRRKLGKMDIIRIVSIIGAGAIIIALLVVVGIFFKNVFDNEDQTSAYREQYKQEHGYYPEQYAFMVDMPPSGETLPPTPTSLPPATPTPAVVYAADEGPYPNANVGTTAESSVRSKQLRYRNNSLTDVLESMEKISTEYPDVKGRLVIGGIMDEVVVQSRNTSYLSRNYRGSASPGGSVYIVDDVDLRFPPENIVLRASDSTPGKGFHSLWQYRDGGAAFAAANAFATLTTLYEEENYVLFAVVVADADKAKSGYFRFADRLSFKTDDEMMAFVSEAMSRSLYPFSVEVAPSDRLMTLGTVSGGADGQCIILMYRMLRDGENAR